LLSNEGGKVNIGELFVTLGFKADTLKLNDFMKSVGELNMTSVASALGLGALYEATSKVMNIADGAAMSVWGFSQTTGIGTKETQQFNRVVEQLGGSSQDATASLKNLQTAMFNVKWGQGDIRPFQAMGIDPRKGIFEALKRVQDFVKSPLYKDDFKRMMVEALGLSDSLIPVLKNSRDITEVMKEQEVINEKQINTMLRFHQVNTKMGQDLMLIWVDIAAHIEPVIEMLERMATLFLRLTDSMLGIKNSWPKSFGEFGKGTAKWLFTPPFSLKELHSMLLSGPLTDVVENMLRVTPGSSQMAGATSYGETHIQVDVSGVNDPVKAAEEAAKKINKMLSDRFYHQGTQKR
jgi:hypothetical protein